MAEAPYDQKRIWDQLQSASGEAAFARSHPRQRFLARRLRHGWRALNIGIGDGHFEALAAARGVDISSLDPSAEAIARAAANRGAERCRVGFSQSIPWPDASFDAVVMTEVLEHLDDAVLAGTLREVARVLAPGGRFIGTVPADEALADSITVCPHCGERFHRFGHLRSFSGASLRGALEAGGFAVARLQRRAFPDFRRRNPLSFAKACAAWIIGRLGEAMADPRYYFEATSEAAPRAAAAR